MNHLKPLKITYYHVIYMIEHFQNVTTNTYDNLTELHIPERTLTTKHIKVFSHALLGNSLQC
jgi:hypothetical protein